MSHIVAVSGMHLSILFALVYALTLRQRVLSALLGIPVAFFLRQWQDLPLGNPGGGDAVSPFWPACAGGSTIRRLLWPLPFWCCSWGIP